MATDESATEPLYNEEALLDTWRKLCRYFSGVRNFTMNPKDAWIHMIRCYVGDITINWKLSYWKKAKALIKPLADAEIDYLRSLTQQRLEFTASLFRTAAVSSVTLPVSFLVLANQLFPKWVREELLSSEDVNNLDIIFLVILLTAISLLYTYMNVLKAREMKTALELEAAGRRLKRGETIVSAGGDATDISL